MLGKARQSELGSTDVVGHVDIDVGRSSSKHTSQLWRRQPEQIRQIFDQLTTSQLAQEYRVVHCWQTTIVTVFFCSHAQMSWAYLFADVINSSAGA